MDPLKTMPPVLTKTFQGHEFKYSIFKLVDQSSQVLRQVTPTFDFSNPPIDPKFLAVSLIESMIKHFGVGLASPQLGLPYRAFAMGAGNQSQVCFNPEIVNSSSVMTNFEEGCLTWKGLYLPIQRPEKIDVRFQDYNGAWVEATYDGLTARTYQHELDHLNGIVFTGLVDKYTLTKRRTKVVANIRKLKAQEMEFRKRQVIEQATRNVLEKKRTEALNKSLSFSTPEVIITK